MVRVELQSEKYDRIEFEFDVFDKAADFIGMALSAAVGGVKITIEKAEEPAGNPQEESRFVEPEELAEVPPEELASVDEFF